MKAASRGKKLETLAARLEIDLDFLRECAGHGALLLDEGEEDFSPAQLARLRRLQRLCLALELDAFAGSIIVELLERLDSVQREMDGLRLGGR